MNLCNCAEHRPIYFWAGPGTIRMNKTKFHPPFDAVNEGVHLEGYEEKGVEKLRNMSINVVYATFDWGYAPEIESEDWQWFKRFTSLAHQYKMEVFAYIQSSNIVWKEWFEYHPESREWLCLTKQGKPFTYGDLIPERYLCCYSNPDWLEHVGKVTSKALEFGADGIFYDNIFHPQQGCHCSSCKRRFKEHLLRQGLNPVSLEAAINGKIQDPYFREWCRFRCNITSLFYQKMRTIIDEIDPTIPMTSNTFDVVNENKVVNCGYDISELIKIENLWMIENFTLPQIEKGVQVNNARTFKVAKAYARDKLVTSVAYIPKLGAPQHGLGTEVHPPRQYKLGMAEASSLQGSLVIKGTEYFDKYWTLITENRFRAQRKVIREYNDFLVTHTDIYQNIEDASNIGLIFHLPSLTWTEEKAFPSFCGFFQTLHQTSIPFEILTEEDLEKADFRKKELLILPSVSCMSQTQIGNLLAYVKDDGKLLITGDIATHKLDGMPYESIVTKDLLVHRNVTYLKKCPAMIEIPKGSRIELREKDPTYHFSYFQLPKNWAKIRDIIIGLVEPFIKVETDVNRSVFVWKKGKEYIVHVVNYDSDSTHEAKVVFPKKITSIRALSPDGLAKDKISFEENILAVKGTEIYDVIRVKLA